MADDDSVDSPFSRPALQPGYPLTKQERTELDAAVERNRREAVTREGDTDDDQ